MSLLHKNPFKITRREVLKVLAGSAGTAASLPILNNAAARDAMCPHAATQEATRPAAPYTPKFFNADQMQTLAELVELIIPTDDHSPGAKAARVHEYIDEVVAAGDEKQKGLWKEGLNALERMANRDSNQKFVRCTSDQQIALLLTISKNEDHPGTLEERFFKALKGATISGYYTSEIGIHKDLQYVGNTYLDDFPGCTHPEHQR